ncbi:hypothetical protein [uncultured Phenylobacterium sp.]|uniref:hypothetical protein n=1 Tax=uncultured Phenylobacterium sp. TaxID=349273 RepID=UPI0025E468B6|nr:hypothetical protein [uncultured Phenylobacterium sp.]
MRPFRLGLLAALMAAFVMPAAAMAQKKSGKDADGAYNAAQMKRGAAEGAAAAQAAGIPCTVSNAAWLGASAADKKTNSAAKDMFEVACSGSMGFMIQVDKGGPAMGFSCLESLSGLACKLPENANPNALLQAALTKNTVACDLSQTRLIGQVPTAQAIYIEALCKDGSGYVLKTSMPMDLAKPIKAEDCLIYDAANTNVKCTLAEPASRLALIDRFVTTAKVNCTVKERRFVGPLKDGTTAYEAACQDGKGYVLKVDNKGGVVPVECAKVPTLCELSDARQAMTEQAGLYTNLAKAAGSNCVVESYAVFPAQPGQEVLELTCKDGAEVVAVFPARGPGKVYDCGHALVAGFKCAPGKLNYSPLTADLRKLGKTDCSVSDVVARAKSAKGNPQIEVACADGLPGYVVEYTDPATPVGALGCRLVGCNLPANNKPKA